MCAEEVNQLLEEKKGRSVEEYIKAIRDLKDKHRRELLELRGIDVTKIDALKKYDELMAEPLKNIGEVLAEGAEEIKTKQLKILGEIQKFPKVRQPIIERLYPGRLPLWWCNYLQTLWNALLCDKSISPSTSTVLNGNKASVNCNASLNSCYPFVELHGGGPGVSRELQVNGWCSFAFIPQTEGVYRIQPFLMVNGYYLFQTWGSCAGGVTSSATLKIRATVTVIQLGIVVRQREVTIYEHTSSDGQFSPIDYVQLLSDSVKLDYPGQTVTIQVGIEVEASITGYGQVIVDIQKNPNFYFRVPYIDISKCYSLVSIRPGPVTEAESWYAFRE